MSEVLKLGITAIHNRSIQEVDSIEVIANQGIVGDRHFKKFNDPYNQISLIESEGIDNYNIKFGLNGFFIFLLFFHSLIGIYGVYRSKVRPAVENPDSQFIAMPQSITPAGIELNPTTEPIEEPSKSDSVSNEEKI